MKNVKYICDLCKEEKSKLDLACFYFKCDIIPQQYMVVSNLDLSDKHICLSCIQTIKNSKL